MNAQKVEGNSLTENMLFGSGETDMSTVEWKHRIASSMIREGDQFIIH